MQMENTVTHGWHLNTHLQTKSAYIFEVLEKLFASFLLIGNSEVN